MSEFNMDKFKETASSLVTLLESIKTVEERIEFLIKIGFTKSQILSLGANPETVDKVLSDKERIRR